MAQIQKGTTYTAGSPLNTVSYTNLNAHVDSAILLPGAITDQTAKTVPVAADTILLHSAADTALRKSTITQLFASPQPIGATTASTIAATTISASSTITGNLTGNVTGNATTSSSCTGNAATATNVAYSGLTGTVPTWNQNTTGSSASCTGNAATATNGVVTTTSYANPAFITSLANSKITGLGAMALNTLSVVESISVNANQTGTSTGAALIFNTPGAPTVNLTVGKWLVMGTCTSRVNDVACEAKLEFCDNGGTNVFGFGSSGLLPTSRDNVAVMGYKVVASGTFDVFFKGTPEAGSTINLGSSSTVAHAGGIIAFKLE